MIPSIKGVQIQNYGSLELGEMVCHYGRPFIGIYFYLTLTLPKPVLDLYLWVMLPIPMGDVTHT